LIVDFSEALILLLITGSAIKPAAHFASEGRYSLASEIMALGLRGYGVLGPMAAAPGH
jgi:hypothetical protein